MPVSVAVTFVGVILHGDPDGDAPPHLEELAHRIGQPYPTVYQNLRYLGSGQMRIGRPGLGLVETWIGEENRRQKFARLTPKGTQLAAKIVQLLEADQ